MSKCTEGPASNPCLNDSAARLSVEGGGVHYPCWRHLTPTLRPMVNSGKRFRINLKGC